MCDRSWRARALTGWAGLALAGLLGCNGNVDVNAPGASVRVRANDRGASVSVRTPDASVNVNAFGMQSLPGIGGGGTIVTRCPPPPDSYPLPGVRPPPPGNPPLPPVYGVDKGGPQSPLVPGKDLGAPVAAIPGPSANGFPGSVAPVGPGGPGGGLISASDPAAVPEAGPEFGDLVFREPIAPATR